MLRKNRHLAEKHKVRGFPTCVLLKDNTVIKTLPGFRPAQHVIGDIDQAKKIQFQKNHLLKN